MKLSVSIRVLPVVAELVVENIVKAFIATIGISKADTQNSHFKDEKTDTLHGVKFHWWSQDVNPDMPAGPNP